MKLKYDAPTLEIDWFEVNSPMALFDPSETTDFIPDTDGDDTFD